MAYLLGIDGGTESLRAGVFDLTGAPLAFAASAYKTRHPQPGWAEQHPRDWWDALGNAVREVLVKADVRPADIAALCLDTTSCSVVALDHRGEAVRPALIWMDVRSGEQARRIAQSGDDALRVNGYGPVSAEWMAPKSLWLKECERANFDAAANLCEYQDYLNYHLTGRLTASLNNASIRWHYDASRGGFEESLYRALDLEDALAKFPREVIPMGEVIGGLTQRAADHLGLNAGTPVVQGGADAFVAMLGLGVVEIGSLAFITGSSHLHLGLSSTELHARGIWGTYPDAVVPGLHVIEGGQTSTGSVVAWLRRLLGEGASYDDLNARAGELPPGAEGLVVLEHFQGNRTPHTDPDSRGVISGLTLRHTDAHLYRAVLEGIAFGTEDIFRAMREAGYAPTRVIACGGATRSPLWLQIHADVSGVPIELTRVPDAAALGSAVLAAVGAHAHATLQDACRAMVHVAHTVTPNPAHTARYAELFEAYRATYRALAPTLHAQAHFARAADFAQPVS